VSSKVCPGCGEDKPRSSFANTELCKFCRADGTSAKPPPETLVDEPPAAEDQFPQVELDYTAPAQKEIASRILARRSLLAFIQRFKPKYQAGWVHADICRRLERFLKAVEAGQSPRLLLLCPPRAGKSEIGSRHFAPWVLGQHPDWEIIAASHSGSLTMSFSRYIRDLVRDPSYIALFPRTIIDPNSQSVENWNILHGGGYLAASVGTGITGRGAHVLLLDDLVRDQEAADSQHQRDALWEWYISTAYTRLAPGGGVLGIMTWWAEDDWAGRIQQTMASGDGDQFEIVKYPAINEIGDEYILADDTIVEIPPGATAPEGARMTRPHGTAIHPERYTTESMLRIKRNAIAAGLKRTWDSLYQQNPLPDEGIYFAKDMFRYYVHQPDRVGRFIYQAWDFAITEKTESDWTVGATILQDEYDNIYLLDVIRFRSGDGNSIIESIIDYALEHKANLLGFEDGQIWKSLKAQFEKRCKERKFYPSYETLVPLSDKMVRANPLKGRMQLGKVYFPSEVPWFSTLQKEMLRFPAGKHDDQVDALSWAIRLTLSKSAPRLKEPKKLKSWRDALSAMMGGKSGGHMSA